MRRIASLIVAICLTVIATGQAPAETDAQWKPNKANKLSSCRSLWVKIGDPLDTRAATRDTTFVCHARYFLSHDNVSKTPDWVIERLTKRQVSGKNDRPSKKFLPEPRVPPVGRAVDKDYPPKESGFARGHMAPSEDFNSSAKAMRDTFVLSNAVPQIGARFNGAIWGTLEDEVRKAAKARSQIYVVTGPVRGTATVRSRTIAAADNSCGKRIVLDGPPQLMFCAANNADSSVPCRSGVGVPIALFKIVYDPKTNEAFAFLLPNRDHEPDVESRPYLERFRVSVAAIEDLTGLQFLRGIAQSKQDAAIKQCTNRTLW